MFPSGPCRQISLPLCWQLDSQNSHAARAFTKALAAEIGTLFAGGGQCWVLTIAGSTISCLLKAYSLGRNNNHSIHCIYVFLDFYICNKAFSFCLTYKRSRYIWISFKGSLSLLKGKKFHVIYYLFESKYLNLFLKRKI